MFASLSSGLLARKGAAKPAMRPQGFGQMGSSLEDLGWNDMGHDHGNPGRDLAPAPVSDGPDEDSATRRSLAAGLSPVVSNAAPVHGQIAELRSRLEAQPEPEAPVLKVVPAEPAPEAVVEPEASAPEPAFAPPVAFEPQPEVEPELPPVREPAPVAILPVRPKRAAPVQPRAEAGARGKSAFTLRLDPARHLRLRLACAVDGRSAQAVVTEALDMYLSSIPELEGLAGQVPGGVKTRSRKG